MSSTFDETVFQQKSVFRKFEVFVFFGGFFWKVVLGVSEKNDGFVIILAWNRDEKCCQGVN